MSAQSEIPAWIQAIGASLALVIAVPALFVALDTQRDQQEVNVKVIQSLQREESRYERRYASRVAWWTDASTLPAGPKEKARRETIFVQNRSTSPLTSIAIAVSTPSDGSAQEYDVGSYHLPCLSDGEEAVRGVGKDLEPFVKMMRESGDQVYECTTVEAVPTEPENLDWYAVNATIPPCSLAEIANPLRGSDVVRLVFSDSVAGWIKGPEEAVAPLLIVSETGFEQGFGYQFTLHGEISVEHFSELEDCTDQL